MNIICYGDSNTYGYNPENGGRYESEYRWTDLLEKDGHKVFNEGLNGREIPQNLRELVYLKSLLEEPDKIDVLILSLGVNDAYNMPKPTARAIADRWRVVFENISAFNELLSDNIPVILVAPPVGPVNFWGGVRSDEISEVLNNIAGEYEILAREKGLIFADANTWDIELTEDGVHFSRKGNQRFYEMLKPIILKYTGNS